MHSDTQGSDLKVMIGLKKFRNCVYKGILETLINSKKKEIRWRKLFFSS